jgi:hypothetical protein
MLLVLRIIRSLGSIPLLQDLSQEIVCLGEGNRVANAAVGSD